MSDTIQKQWTEEIKASYIDLIESVLRHNMDLIIPKLHFIGHYILMILRLGIPNQFNTLGFEQKNKVATDKMRRNMNWLAMKFKTLISDDYQFLLLSFEG